MTPLGLRTRLALVFATGFAVLLGLGALGLFLHLARSYRRDFDHGLTDAARSVRALFELDRPEYVTAAATATHVVAELVYGDRTLVAFDSAGRFLAASQRLPDEAHFDDVPHRGPTGRLETVTLRDGPARISRVSLDGVSVVIAMSTLPLERRLVLLRRSLVTVLPLILVLGALVGAWSSRIGAATDRAGRTSRRADRRGGRSRRDRLHPAARAPGGGRAHHPHRCPQPAGGPAERRPGAGAGVAERQRGFLAEVAHELRTPVAILRSEAEVTLRGRRRTRPGTGRPWSASRWRRRSWARWWETCC